MLFAEGEELLVGHDPREIDLKLILFLVSWDKGRYTYDRIFVFKPNQSRESNALWK